MKKIIKVIVLILSIVSFNWAGTIMISEYKELSNPRTPMSTHTIYLQKDLIKMDIKTDKEEITTIFRGDKELFWMIEHKEKRYTEMTKQDLEKIQKEMEQAISQMQELTKELPGGLKNKVQSIIAPTPSTKPPITYQKVASNEKINQWLTDKYIGFRNGKKEIEVWTTPYEKLALKAEELKAFEKMGEFFKNIIKNTNWFYQIGQDEKSTKMYFGFPIRTIIFEKDKPVFQHEVKSIEQKELLPIIFELPKGYKKVKMND